MITIVLPKERPREMNIAAVELYLALSTRHYVTRDVKTNVYTVRERPVVTS
jgi:hypothetical protein